jgi:hypothetical protein
MYTILIFLFAFLYFTQVVRLAEPGLRELYFKGPRFQGYGFWNGLPITDVCAQLTHTAVELWTNNLPQCITITNRYFDAFYVGVYSVAYLWLLINFLYSLQQMAMYRYQYKLFCQLHDLKEKNNRLQQ